MEPTDDLVYVKHCKHVQCRKPRQDLQCSRAPGHDQRGDQSTRHYHSIALGYCEGRYSHLNDGSMRGHLTPV